MQPESSDGFASVGTVLPDEEVALLPGGLFAFVAAKREQIYWRKSAVGLRGQKLTGRLESVVLCAPACVRGSRILTDS